MIYLQLLSDGDTGYFERETENGDIRTTSIGDIRITEDDGNGSLTFFPRSTTFDTLVFTNDTTGTVITDTAFSIDTIVYGVTVSFSADGFDNDVFYTLQVLSSGVEVFTGKVYASNQNKDTYSINNNNYTITEQLNNEFITI